MASIYKFPRKSKKEDPEKISDKNRNNDSHEEDFFPLLFEDAAENDLSPKKKRSSFFSRKRKEEASFLIEEAEEEPIAKATVPLELEEEDGNEAESVDGSSPEEAVFAFEKEANQEEIKPSEETEALSTEDAFIDKTEQPFSEKTDETSLENASAPVAEAENLSEDDVFFTNEHTDSTENASELSISEEADEHSNPDVSREEEPSLTAETETVSIPENEAEATREINFEKETSEEDSLKYGETRSFSWSDLPSSNGASETNPARKSESEAASPALDEEEKRQQKFNEIFLSSRSRAESPDHDKTASLLMEVFGEDPTKTKKQKRKKKKELSSHEVPREETDPIQEMIHSDFVPENTSETELQKSPAPEKTKAEEEYVAIHDSAEESTKEYHSSFSFEEELEQIRPETEHISVPKLSEEIRVPDQENPYNDTYDDFEEKQEKRAVLPEEFTSNEEYDEFAEYLRNRNFKAVCGCAWSLLLFFVVLYLESATFSSLYHPEFLKPGGIYNSIYLLVDIQLVLLCSLLVLPSLGEGLIGFFRGKPNRNTITCFISLFCLIHPCVLLVLGETDYPLFGSVAALFAFMTAVGDMLESKRIYRTFRVFGKRGEKYVAEELIGDCAEAEAFKNQLEGSPKFYSVQRANFIDGFFRRVGEPAGAEKSVLAALIISLLFSVGFAVWSYWKAASIGECANRFMMMTVMTLPLSSVFTVVLPFSHLSKKAEKRGCAILSAKEADLHADSDAVSFTDREIFPPKSVKVTTIRTYGKTRIDKALLYAAMIFQKLGGPLSFVFKKAISGVCNDISEDFNFLEITADGMCAKIDGQSVFVGNKNYLLSYDFGYTKDDIDDSFESKSGKIMYMVIGSELAAKFYIRYSISKRFQKIILSLFKAGICPAVKTCDPNIDSDLFKTLLDNERIPSGIIKT